MNIVVFGGRFDPPHFGHLLVAQQTLEKMEYLDEVWLMPANTHPWKKTIASPEDRLNMTNILVSANRGIKASDFDIKRGGETYTVETVELLKKQRPDKFYWLLGSDGLGDFHRWKDWERLAKLIPFIVFPRDNYPAKNLPFGFKLVEDDSLLTTNYSSSVIRERVKRGLSLKGFVPERVEEYIREHGLYK